MFDDFGGRLLAIALLTIVTRLPSLLHPQAIDDEETYSVCKRDRRWRSALRDAVERAHAHS
jgi:hypothetical protein